MLRLNDSEIRSLLSQPETGMGYQLVEAILRDYRTERGIAFNGELLFLGTETLSPLRSMEYRQVLELAQSSGSEIKSLRVLTSRDKSFGFSAGVRERFDVAKTYAGPAKDAPIENTSAGDIFKRFSAYENDRRITPERGLLAGSYATTEEDAKNVETGKQAVARYALANPQPASYRFTIRPLKDTSIQRGVVEAANDQPGGGPEVIFPGGTQKDTVTIPPDKLPDE